MKKRNYLVLLFASLCLLLLVGFGTQTVKLLNERPPLIDLDAAIQEGQFGKNGNETQEGDDPTKPFSGKSNDIIIKIHNESIYYGERKCNNLQQLEAWINGDYKTGGIIRLKDDYAEAKKYKEVMKLLEQLNNDKGYRYNAD